MKATLFLIPLLILIAPLSGDQVLAHRLLPYHFNTVIVVNDGTLKQVQIYGSDFQGRDHLLFESPVQRFQRQISCILYLDRELYTVQMKLHQHNGESEEVGLDIENDPFRVGVYVPPGTALALTDPFYPVSKAEDLEPGDISLDADIPGLRNRGIHLFAGDVESIFPAWRGAALAGSASVDALHRHRDALTTIKEQYLRRLAAAPLHGVVLETEDLQFPANASIGDIAATLQDRLPPLFHGRFLYTTAAAVLLCTLALLFLRRQWLYIAISAVVLVFGLLVGLNQYPGATLVLKINLEGWQDSTLWRKIEGEPAMLYEPVDFTRNKLWMKQEVLRHYSRSLPLASLSTARLIKFNQYPLIRPDGGGYVLSFRNPLKIWTLHDPQ